MEELDIDQRIYKSIRHHWVIAAILSLILIGGIGGWAFYTKIAGAVIASGMVVVESNVKQIQHSEGGIVKLINVKSGDLVKEGDLLIELEDRIMKSNFAIITRQLDELYSQESRLISEQSKEEQITFDYQKVSIAHDDMGKIMGRQRELFNARRNDFIGRKNLLRKQIAQLEKKIDGLKATENAKHKEMSLINNEIKTQKNLLKQGYVDNTRLTTLNKRKAQIAGDIGAVIAQKSEARGVISERELEIFQIEEDFRARIIQQLQEVRSSIAQLKKQQVIENDKLTRARILAPTSGYIHNLLVHTEGGVIGAGETIMLIVPQKDHLVIEVQAQPKDINQLYQNQEAKVRLPSFNQRITPELTAKIQTISADLVRDESSGSVYYQVRLNIPNSELEKLNGKELLPGMPVEAFIKTDDRTVASYLIKPISDQIAHSMKEY